MVPNLLLVIGCSILVRLHLSDQRREARERKPISTVRTYSFDPRMLEVVEIETPQPPTDEPPSESQLDAWANDHIRNAIAVRKAREATER